MLWKHILQRCRVHDETLFQSVAPLRNRKGSCSRGGAWLGCDIWLTWLLSGVSSWSQFLNKLLINKSQTTVISMQTIHHFHFSNFVYRVLFTDSRMKSYVCLPHLTISISCELPMMFYAENYPDCSLHNSCTDLPYSFKCDLTDWAGTG